jgi:ABC-2 type transport system ATP-binding protein
MLIFRDVDFGYKRNQPVISGFTLAFKPGNTLLLGPNGAGKSTVFALASGALRPKAGTVERKASVGLLSQQVPIFPHLTAWQQVAYVAWLAMKPMKQAEKDAMDALRQVGLFDKTNEKPKNLSGGELRRLGIAGLLNSDASVMLLDEPTAGLDIAQCASFYSTLKNLDQGKTVIVCTHQIDGITDYFDFVVVLFDGKLLFNDTMAKFIELGNLPENQYSSNPLVNAYSELVAIQL